MTSTEVDTMDAGSLRAAYVMLMNDYQQALAKLSQQAPEEQEPVGRVKTVGGYPDDSEHTVEWMCKYKDLVDGDYLYTAPQPAKHGKAGK